MASEELMENRMSEDELEQVAGGAKVLVIAHMKNGKINGYHSDFKGDINKLKTLAAGGKVDSINASGTWGSHMGIDPSKLGKLVERYKQRGYQVIETREK